MGGVIHSLDFFVQRAYAITNVLIKDKLLRLTTEKYLKRMREYSR